MSLFAKPFTASRGRFLAFLFVAFAAGTGFGVLAFPRDVPVAAVQGTWMEGLEEGEHTVAMYVESTNWAIIEHVVLVGEGQVRELPLGSSALRVRKSQVGRSSMRFIVLGNGGTPFGSLVLTVEELLSLQSIDIGAYDSDGVRVTLDPPIPGKEVLK